MKISKKTLLATWSFFSVATLWLMFVSGAWDNLFSNPDKELEINPSNAIQHFQNVKMIATGNTDDANATISKNWNIIKISTNDNFIISTGEIIKPCDWNNDGIITEWDLQSFNLCILFGSCTDNKYDLNNDWIVSVTDVMICTNNYLYKQDNKITQWVKWSSILWWFGNRIKKWINQTIIWWIFNAINTGDSNSILWWKNNSIENGTNSVIFWWENNKITWARWENSAIIWSTENTINISDATIVWNNNTVDWQYSIAAWKKAKVSGKNSFLWSDGRNSELSKNNVFAVIWDNGMVVNSTEAHSIAQLTISGSLTVFDDKNAPECTEETKWVLKVITGDNYNNEQECFCSCDGSWRNALHEWTRCTALCAYGTWLEAECGEIKINCGDNPYSYTWDELSGACAKWELVWWTGAFFVTTNKDWNTLTDYINRSCQVTDWHVSQCYQKLNESCPNINTWYECLWSYENVTWHIIINEEVPKDSASFRTYDPDLKWPCTYKCDQYGEWDPIEEKCTFHACTWELSEGAQVNDEMVLPMDDYTEYFYDETSTGACAYSCSIESWYRYDPITDKCVPAGCDIAVTEVKDLEVFILSNTWNISHYTMMDRNLWATETFNQDDDSPNEESYGCYFQRWNNYPFNKDRSGSLYTRETLTNTTDYGPNRTKGYYLNPKYYCTSGDSDIMYPRDGSGIPIATWFWWWWATDFAGNYYNWYWIDWSDEDRQWPCPEWYHIPRGSEMESILNEWKEVSEYPTEDFSEVTLQKSKEFASDLLLPFAWYWGFSCSSGRTLWLGKRGTYAIWDYYKRKNQLHIWKSVAGNGAYLFLNWPAYGYSMRCVKNDISANQKVTIHANGWSNAVITIDWETPENGKITSLGNPIKTGYSFLWWYFDSSFSTSWNVWDNIANNGHLYAKWEYKDCDVEQTAVQNLELFFISSTGEISHYTMMDRNLGAFEIYNQKGESAQNARSYWCHFQWWNNHGFSLWSSTTRYWINPTNYGPNNYYSNNKFYCYYKNSSQDPWESWEDRPEDDESVYGVMYSPKNYHMRWWGYIQNNGNYKYWSNGSDEDRQWPCPSGYHVPGWVEMNSLINNWNDASISQWAIWKNFASDLLMPFGRYIEVYCGRQWSLRVWWWIWLSDHIYKYYGWEHGWSYTNHVGKFTDETSIRFATNWRAHGFPVRCVKNGMTSSPQKVTINTNGWTGAVIGIDWESEGSGKITALWTPSKNWIEFLWWYTDSSFTADSKVTTWDYISNSGNLYAKWNECNIEDTVIQDLDIYILWSTWNTTHYVMMDRSLWATEVYNQNYGSSNQTSFGCYFQWWNNYPFHRTNITRTQVQANVDGYWPDNYYSRGLYFCNTDEEPINRFTRNGTDWMDLRWWVTNTETSKKWPCPTWYHIPHSTEFKKLIEEWKVATTITWWRQFANDTLTPFNGAISPRCNEGFRIGDGGSFWMANANSSAGSICHLSLWNFTNGEVVSCRTNSAVHAFPVRCVKDDMTTAPQKITIHANGWTGAVISIDWETAENGKIVSISEPRKSGTEFQWWYLDEWFTNPVGDYISNGSHLYAKWNECNISDTQVQDLEVFFILSTWDVSHYTLMDRNLWAREAYNQNYSSQNEESYGCYFQSYNSYAFNRWRNGASYTTETFTGARNYGPNTSNGYYYNSKYYCTSGSGDIMYPRDGSGYPIATWLWWWWYTNDWINYRNDGYWSRWTDWSDIDRQWPCPTGYHVPRGTEMENILNEWKEISNYPTDTGHSDIELQKSKIFASDLLLPFAWFNGVGCSESNSYKSKGLLWQYRIWDFYKHKDHFYFWDSNAGDGIHFYLNWPAHGFSMRCVKNDISANQKVTIHANGWTGAVIAIDWETDWTGKITTLWTPTKGWIQFQWWFSDEWLTNPVNAGDYISSGSNLYAKWEECKIEETKIQDLEVYLLSSTWEITHYTMMDRNLWAEQAFNQNFSSPNEKSYGCYFQWWNNYGFLKASKSTNITSETLTDPENYGPNRQNGYYSNPKRFCYEDYIPMYPRYNNYLEKNFRLWGGGKTNSNGEFTLWSDWTDIDRQWPCPIWYHIPKGKEMENIINERQDSLSSSGLGVVESQKFASNLLLPFAGTNDVLCWTNGRWTLLWKGTHGDYNISDYWEEHNHLHIWDSNYLSWIYLFLNWPAHGFSIRCVKNNISANQKITIHPNGWTNSVVSIDWETDGTGKITALSTPNKKWYRFEWWYLDEGFDNEVHTGDYISSGDHLYAKWGESIATLLPWKTFNQRIKKSIRRTLDYDSVTSSITEMKEWTWDTIPSWITTTLVSTDDSPYPVYTRIDSWTLYYYTKANKIYMNPDSSYMFFGFFYGDDNPLTSLNLNKFDSSKVTTMEAMFQHCENLTWIEISNWDTSNVTDMSRMFYYCHNLANLDVSKWNTSNVTDMTATFQGCRNLTELDVSKWDTSSVTSMQQMFSTCDSLTELDVSKWDTSNVTNMSHMFMLTSNLKPHLLSKLDVSKWDTSNVTDMQEMFYGCHNLTWLDVSKWNTSNVKKMDGMFVNCYNLTWLDVSRWDTSNVTMMAQMFDGCNNLTELDVSNWDTHNVKYMNGMFKNCSSLTNLNVSKWNTNNVMNTESMFYGCTNLEWLDISKWNTNNVNNMEYMFYNCKNLTELDVSNWNTNRTYYMQYMFGKCSNLKTIYSSWWSFNTTYVTSSNNMFSWDTKIMWGFGTRYNSSKLNKEYARIDSESQSGYFTQLKAATLLPWSSFKNTLISLAGNETNITKITQYTWNITPSWVTTWLLSTNDSPYPVYAWFNNWTIYYYTEANKIYLNSDSSSMFSDMTALVEIDTTKWKTDNVTNMEALFKNCNSLTELDVSNWNTSKVNNMSGMFSNCESLTELNVREWDTSNVTSMRYMFWWGTSVFINLESLDVSKWDTSKVTNMEAMFQHCINLTWLDVSRWDTSNVTNMNHMFYHCNNLETLDVSKWNTSKVTNMRAMFDSCTSLKFLEVKDRDTSNVTTMEFMFWWDVNTVMNFEYLDVSKWNTSNVTNMNSIFQNCENLTWLDVSHWNTSKVVDMSYMFENCKSLTGLNVSNFDTSKVTNMEAMFSKCNNLEELDVNNFDTSNVTNMRHMFWSDSGVAMNLKNLDISNWDTSKVTNMEAMFQNCKNLVTIYASTWFVTNLVTSSNNMFTNDTKLVWWFGTTYTSSHKNKEYARIDSESQSWYFTHLKAATLLSWKTFNQTIKRLSSPWATYNSENTTITKIIQYTWNTIPSWVTTWLISNNDSVYPVYARYNNGTIYYYTEADRIYMNPDSSYMFYNMKWLTELDISEWNTSRVTNMSRMFVDCINLENLDVTNWNTSKVTDMSYLFRWCNSLTNLDVSKWNTSNVTNMNYLFSNCENLTWLDVSKWNTSNVTSMRLLFWWTTGVNMKLNYLDVSNWDVSNVTSMVGMFQRCWNLTWLDVSKWNTSNVTDMFAMFFDCYSLTNLDVSNWNTSNVTNMRGLFNSCKSLTWLDVSRWDTSNVTNMRFMFWWNDWSVSNLGVDVVMNLKYVDVSKWDTSNVTDMSAMFINCQNLTWLDVSKWDTSKVTDMSYIFKSCEKLTWLNVSNWDTSNVTDMKAMFADCSNLTSLDLSNWDTSNLTGMSHMFHNSSKLKTIYASTKFVTNNVTDSYRMFGGCSKLVWWNGTTYNSSYVDKTYARIDQPWTPWYFTLKQ